MATAQSVQDNHKKVLVFSTENISDPGIDFAGSSHMRYNNNVLVVSVPCSSGIKPEWILYALKKGFDGVFIAADGSDCVYVTDCTKRTGQLFERAQTLLKENEYDPRRLKMGAICSVCAESFVNYMNNFQKDLAKLA
jgi:coenzyme F420-reducing hydrogenase delta subunit